MWKENWVAKNLCYRNFTFMQPMRSDGYEALVQVVDQLVDVVGEDEAHPLASLLDVLGVLIEKYEDDNVAELSA